ncbi:hypothetical protein [Macrococcus animalis]|uniref:hypothetical protein n=1 Tax=Macrococcus animalis TaxID=3395467 RepID=UPI0039BDC866
MIFVIGEVFQDRLAPDDMQDILNTMPIPIALKLSGGGYNVNLNTRFKDNESLPLLKRQLEEKNINFNQFEDKDTYKMDEWDLDVIYDMFSDDTIIFFSNIGDDAILDMAEFSKVYDCISVMYINKLFVSLKTLKQMEHCFIEEAYALGYIDDIPKDRFTIIPKGFTDVEAAELMYEVIKDIEDSMNKMR